MLSPQIAPKAASGVDAFVLLLRFYEIAVDRAQIRHQLGTASFGFPEILRCAKGLRLKSRATVTDWARLAQTPLPALADAATAASSSPRPSTTRRSSRTRRLGGPSSSGIALDTTRMQVEGRMVDLAPGMAVTIEIKTGQRRIIEYLLSPLLRYKQESLRER
jgi:hypothetical protein